MKAAAHALAKSWQCPTFCRVTDTQLTSENTFNKKLKREFNDVRIGDRATVTVLSEPILVDF